MIQPGAPRRSSPRRSPRTLSLGRQVAREEGGQPPARRGCASRGASVGAKKMVPTQVRLRPPMDFKNPLAYSADEVLVCFWLIATVGGQLQATSSS